MSEHERVAQYLRLGHSAVGIDEPGRVFGTNSRGNKYGFAFLARDLKWLKWPVRLSLKSKGLLKSEFKLYGNIC